MTKVSCTFVWESWKLTISYVGEDIKPEQYNEGLVKHRGKHTNHKSTSILLAVPWYSDLLNDQADKDENEHGCLLVNTAEGWWTEMEKWIAASRAADAAEGIKDAVEVVAAAATTRQGLQAPAIPTHSKWKTKTLKKLFGRKAQHLPQLVPAEIKAEAALMQALVELEEDKWLDDGEVGIASEDEYME